MRTVMAAALLATILNGTLSTLASAAPAYNLGPGDEVRVKVYEWRSPIGDVHEWAPLNGEFSVGADGSVSLPLVGAIPAGGHTTDDLAAVIATRLQQTVGLLAPPHASVEVVKYRPFYILGSVNKPGEYPFRPGMTVLQAVSIAGGVYRMSDPGLLLAQRSTISSVGDLRVLQLDFNALSARRATLKAELDGTAKIAFPRELIEQQGDPAVAQLIEQQQTMFNSRAAALRSEIDALNRLKDLLNGQVTSMAAKMNNLDQELTLLKNELAGTSSLVQRGLAVAPREFALRQTELQTEGRRLDLDTAMLRAREDIAKADQALIELNNKMRDAALTELSQVESKLAQTAARIKISRAIIAQESTGPDLAAVLGQDLGPPSYSIIRQGGDKPETLGATDASLVQPGDTIEVKRAGISVQPVVSGRDMGETGPPVTTGAVQPEPPSPTVVQKNRRR